jgi:hypothetical protein
LPVPAAAETLPVPLQQAVAELATPVRRHHYALGVICIALECVLDACQSFYASAWVIQLLAYVGDGIEEVPSYAGIRLWLLRVGLYKLLRPLERAVDWIWIVDHTMQCGDRKCLIILGLRCSVWQAAPDRRLRRQDVEVIALEPVLLRRGRVYLVILTSCGAKTRSFHTFCSSRFTEGFDRYVTAIESIRIPMKATEAEAEMSGSKSLDLHRSKSPFGLSLFCARNFSFTERSMTCSP